MLNIFLKYGRIHTERDRIRASEGSDIPQNAEIPKTDGRDTLKAEIPPRRIFSDGGREKEFYIYGKNR